MVRLVKEYAQQILKRMEQQKRRREKRSQIVASVVSEDESAQPAVAETGTPLKRRRVVLDDSDLRVCLK